ncbi:F-box domain containing protein, expressed [Panicum miliaceum]|uniref:F-box domain containing protein, expressed n=1 Tax=Panicum miliaceum TaxID=4540 RepID=A0A3L6S430_PANMI|nr:F-box domain containing protein, expressed [Panicum miliaceum]
MAAELGPLVDFLPDKIVRSILARVPARSVRRFRAVSRSWRRLLTFDRGFLVEHHRQQRLEPMVAFIDYTYAPGDMVDSQFGVQAFDFRTGEIREAVTRGSAVAQDRHVFDDSKVFKLHGSCNGLLLYHFHRVFYVCNPATGQRACLPPLQSDEVAALYCYDNGAPLEEYRVMYHRGQGPDKCYYIISLRTLDRREKIRAIGRPSFSTSASLDAALVKGPSPAWARPPLQLKDSLHWPPQESQEHRILVFDTVTEVFSRMSTPVVMQEEDTVVLLEMQGKLAMSTCRRGALVVELFILEDYHDEIWVCAHRIQLPVELTRDFDYQEGLAFIGSEDGDVLVSTPQSVLHYNRNGRRVKDFVPKGFPHYVTTHLLKESLVPYYIAWNMDPPHWF